MKIEGLMAYRGKWQNRKEFIIEDYNEFKHLVKTIKNHEGSGSQWILTDTGYTLILHSITHDFRFTHSKTRGVED